MIRSRATSTVLIVGIPVAVATAEATFEQSKGKSKTPDKPTAPIHIMNDGFSYEVIDLGVGTVRADVCSVRPTAALWLALRVTNLSGRQLLIPQYPSQYVAVDDAKN